MTQEGFKRKLIAILSADAVGYSRLMRQDEAATVSDIEAHRALISEIIQQHHGRVIDSPGDNLLSEFASVVDAVKGAVEIQKEIKKSNTDIPEERRMEFRIGINLGDVIEEQDRIYGDGVNIAARVEGLAEAGGISISGTVYEHIKDKLSLGYNYLGEQNVKNIPEPVKVYRLLTEPEAAGKIIGQKELAGKKKIKLPAIAAILAALIVAGFVFWQLYQESSNKVEAASVEDMAFPLPDDPSIVVLPFENLSDDPDQLYLSDGITNQIIAALSQLPGVFVIASQSASTYRGKPAKAKQVSEDLGVRYVLKGNMQKSDKRVRVNAELIDAVGGRIIWAKKFDNELKEIFELQDELVFKIIDSLALKLEYDSLNRGSAYAKIGTSNLEAYLKVMQSLYHFKRFNRENNPMARKLAVEALQLDPDYTGAYNILGWTHLADVWLGLSKSPQESLSQAFQLAQKIIAMKEGYIPGAHGIMCHVYTYRNQYDLAIAECEKAVELAPAYYATYSWLGDAFYAASKTEEAITMFEKSLRMNPRANAYQFWDLGRAYWLAGRYEDAAVALEKSIIMDHDFYYGYYMLACVYATLNREDDARIAVKNVIRLNPKFSLKEEEQRSSFKNPADHKKFVACLRKAGLPD
jgi:adenylate cyclase